jgi:hypothetical protein
MRAFVTLQTHTVIFNWVCVAPFHNIRQPLSFPHPRHRTPYEICDIVHPSCIKCIPLRSAGPWRALGNILSPVAEFKIIHFAEKDTESSIKIPSVPHRNSAGGKRPKLTFLHRMVTCRGSVDLVEWFQGRTPLLYSMCSDIMSDDDSTRPGKSGCPRQPQYKHSNLRDAVFVPFQAAFLKTLQDSEGRELGYVQ